MTELLTAEQVRAAERDAISAGVANGLMLMERAGAAVVDVCFERWPELTDATDRRALILCGPGNNGGDGFVVARLLSAVNWRVTTLLYGDEAALPPDAAENLRRWRAMGGEVAPLEATSAPVEYGEFVDLLVDAVFGAGLSRPLPDDFVAAGDAVWRNAP